MTRHTLLVAVALLAPAAAGAQSFPTLHVQAAGGWYDPIQSLPPLPGEPGSVAASLSAGPAVGVSVETPLAGPVAVRAGWLHAFTTLETGNDAEARDRSRAPVDVLVADLVLRAPALGPVRPYLLVGTGVKRYSFSSSGLTAEQAAALDEGTSATAGHLGVGVAVDAGRAMIALEAGDFTNRFGSSDGAAGAGIGERQHDLAFVAAVRVRL